MTQTVVFACDELYARPTTVAGVSMLANTSLKPHEVTIYIIDGGITPNTRDKMLTSWEGFDVRFVHPDLGLIHSLPVADIHTEAGHINTSMWLRTLVPSLLPSNIDRAVYLDSDVIVRGDIRELFEPGLLAGRPLAAVKDTYVSTVSSTSGLRNYQSLGIPPDADYFNSGLLVFDMPAWRSNKFADTVINYAHQHATTLQLPDQEALNAVLWNRWTKLDPAWNVLDFPLADRTGPGAVRPILKTAKMIHFAGPEKPYRTNYFTEYGPHGVHGVGLFWFYEGVTAWEGQPLEKWVDRDHAPTLSSAADLGLQPLL